MWKVRSGRPYIQGMSRHSLAEAQERLPELIARAVAGEEVLIMSKDGPAVVLRLHARGEDCLVGPVDPEKLAWLESLVVTPDKPTTESAGEYVGRMRDEDWR